mmetsp:Transcript_35896/g.86407  ORF Transcript_35896/g.86407 Transcript_35896/m.86407 type:complete len:302 (+) Transcript_35896:599-1504(+)
MVIVWPQLARIHGLAVDVFGWCYLSLRRRCGIAHWHCTGVPAVLHDHGQRRRRTSCVADGMFARRDRGGSGANAVSANGRAAVVGSDCVRRQQTQADVGCCRSGDVLRCSCWCDGGHRLRNHHVVQRDEQAGCCVDIRVLVSREVDCYLDRMLAVHLHVPATAFVAWLTFRHESCARHVRFFLCARQRSGLRSCFGFVLHSVRIGCRAPLVLVLTRGVGQCNAEQRVDVGVWSEPWADYVAAVVISFHCHSSRDIHLCCMLCLQRAGDLRDSTGDKRRSLGSNCIPFCGGEKGSCCCVAHR